MRDTFVETKDAATGVALITVDDHGENTMVVASGRERRSCDRRTSQRRSSTAPLSY